MKLLIQLSLRNLLRQKRRNILLGSAMALGVMILVVANSFSHGISDIMFNKIMRYATGHITVRFNEKSGVMREIFRDKERVLAAVKDEPVIEQTDEAIGLLMRAIGNGKADNIILIGVDTYKGTTEKERRELEESFRMVEGTWKDIENKAVENPAIVSTEKARYLNVKRNDVIRVRFRNMFGQDQAARLTVVGIVKNDNIFMQPVIFIEADRAKELLGYRPWETASLNLTIANPQKNARALADRIHSRLNPGYAFISGTAASGSRSRGALLLGVKSDDEAKKQLAGLLRLAPGELDRAFTKKKVIVSPSLAGALGLVPGGTVTIRYDNRFETKQTEITLTVAGIAPSGTLPADNAMLLGDEKFYDTYYGDMPKNAGVSFTPSGPWGALLSPEWILLKRTANTDEYQKKYQQMGRKKWKGTTVDVSTMYETASDILKLEGVLNLITLSAVMVLFFIILLGVINTLRMTIRERTREIGTIRAIGMQKNDVRNMFILETLFLTLFASAAGVLGGFGVMAAISHITVNMADNPFGMLLVDGHFYFLPSFAGVAGNVLLIVAIAVATAFFPAKRAAKMSPAKALRHFE